MGDDDANKKQAARLPGQEMADCKSKKGDDDVNKKETAQLPGPHNEWKRPGERLTGRHG